MSRPILSVLCAVALTGCESPADSNPEQFQASAFVEQSPWPTLLPKSEFVVPEPVDTDLAGLSAEELAIRAEALRARAALLSDAVMTPEERARLQAAAALWTGN